MATIEKLAELLSTSPLIVKKLIRIAYLKGGKGLVELPPPAALAWLKQMLQPLPLRPLFKIDEVLQMSGLNKKLFRQIILAWEIPLHYDHFLGELMSPVSLIQLINALHSLREPLRFDRAVLLNWMQGLGSDRQIKPKLPYSKLIEDEIARIAQLKEPERTMAARGFYYAFKDARTISHALNYKYSKVRITKHNKLRELQMAALEQEAHEVLLESVKPPTFVSIYKKKRETAKKARRRREKWAQKEATRRASERADRPAPPSEHPEPDPAQSP